MVGLVHQNYPEDKDNPGDEPADEPSDRGYPVKYQPDNIQESEYNYRMYCVETHCLVLRFNQQEDNAAYPSKDMAQ